MNAIAKKAQSATGCRLVNEDVTWRAGPLTDAERADGFVRVDCERGGPNFNLWIVRRVVEE